MKLKLFFVPKIDGNLRKVSLSVGIGEYLIASTPSSLSTWALGSCISVILYDPFKKVGALSHCMLPEPPSPSESDNKYVSIALPNMVHDLERLGINRLNLHAAVIGGANIFGFSGKFDIGRRNVSKAIKILNEYKIPIDILDVGGNKGRNVVFLLSTGEIFVSYTTKNVFRRSLYGRAFNYRSTTP